MHETHEVGSPSAAEGQRRPPGGTAPSGTDRARAIASATAEAWALEARGALAEGLCALDGVAAEVPAASSMPELSAGDPLCAVCPAYFRARATIQQALGAWSPAVDAWCQAHDWFELVGERHAALAALHATASVWEWSGHPERAFQVYGLVIARARKLGNEALEAECYAGLAGIAVQDRCWEEARQWAWYARTLALELNDPLTCLTATVVLAECRDHDGARAQAIELLVSTRDMVAESVGPAIADGLLTPLTARFHAEWRDELWDSLRTRRRVGIALA